MLILEAWPAIMEFTYGWSILTLRIDKSIPIPRPIDSSSLMLGIVLSRIRHGSFGGCTWPPLGAIAGEVGTEEGRVGARYLVAHLGRLGGVGHMQYLCLLSLPAASWHASGSMSG